MPEYRTTSLAKSLPATVPFVGPEAQERILERAFSARIGANENVFGPSEQGHKGHLPDGNTGVEIWRSRIL